MFEHNFENINFKAIPLTALSKQSTGILSASLNTKMILSSSENISRDWSGLAMLLNINKPEQNLVEQSSDRMTKLIDIWIASYKESHFESLLENLKRIDRHDVYDDIIRIMANDARSYLNKPALNPVESLPARIENVHNFERLAVRIEAPAIIEHPKIESRPEDHFITKQDFDHNKPQIYDAFILYDEDDIRHMKDIEEIVGKLESKKFKICIKERDFLMGIDMEHGAVMNMIANRCHRVIIFVSKKLLTSRYTLFISQFCQRLSIDDRCRKLIPILMEDVNLPLSLKYQTPFRYYKRNRFTNFYEILETSLKLAKGPSSCSTMNIL